MSIKEKGRMYTLVPYTRETLGFRNCHSERSEYEGKEKKGRKNKKKKEIKEEEGDTMA